MWRPTIMVATCAAPAPPFKNRLLVHTHFICNLYTLILYFQNFWSRALPKARAKSTLTSR